MGFQTELEWLSRDNVSTDIKITGSYKVTLTLKHILQHSLTKERHSHVNAAVQNPTWMTKYHPIYFPKASLAVQHKTAGP